MGTPFKMKGHTLPGIKQNPASPLKEPISALTLALISGGISAATAGAKGLAAKKAAKKAEKGAKEKEARDAVAAGADATGVEGSKTKLTD